MKTLIVYHSFHHGNTAKIAKVLADELNAKMVKTEDEETNNWDEYELIGFGSGIYNGKHHKSILHAVEKLPTVKGKKAFVFSTSGVLRNYNKSLKEMLTTKGFQIVGDFVCKALDTYGPLKLIGGLNKGRPNEEDYQKAREFSQGLLP